MIDYTYLEMEDSLNLLILLKEVNRNVLKENPLIFLASVPLPVKVEMVCFLARPLKILFVIRMAHFS